MTNQLESAPRGARYSTLVMAMSCWCMSTGSFFIVGPAACLSSVSIDLHMQSEALKGFFLSAVFWGSMFTTLIGGWIADRFGYRTAFLASALFQCVGYTTIARADVVWVAILGGIVVGLGRGTVTAPLTGLTGLIYPHRRASMMNLLHAFFHIGTIVTVVLVLILFRVGWSWRTIFQLLGILILPYGLVCLVLPLPAAKARSAVGPKTSWTDIIRDKAFVHLLVGALCGGMIEIGVANWLPYFLQSVFGADRDVGLFALMLFGFATAVGRLVASVYVHKIGVRLLLLGGGVLCAVSLFLASLSDCAGWSVTFLSVLGLGVSVFMPTIASCAGDRFPAAGPWIYGVVVGSFLLGCLLGPVVIGLVADGVGLRWGMAVLAVVPLLALLSFSRRVLYTHASHEQG